MNELGNAACGCRFGRVADRGNELFQTLGRDAAVPRPLARSAGGFAEATAESLVERTVASQAANMHNLEPGAVERVPIVQMMFHRSKHSGTGVIMG